MHLDFGYIYSNAVGYAEGVFNNSYRAENSFASNPASKKEQMKTNLKKYISDMRENVISKSE